MNYDDAIKAMVRKYAFEQTSRFALTDEQRVEHIVAEAQHMIARKYGFSSAQEMDEAMQGLGDGVELAEYMGQRSKHLPINQVEQVAACERVDNWKGRNCR